MGSQQKNKKCSKCGIVLPAIIGNFYRDNHKTDKLSPSCSNCCRATKRKTYNEHTSLRLKKDRELARELFLLSDDYTSKLYESKLKTRERNKRYRDKNRDIINLKQKNRIRKIISVEKKKEYRKSYYEKMMTCPYKKHIHYMRIRMNSLVKRIGYNNVYVDKKLLFTKKEFIEHIESKFTNGMSWENYGRNGWHIDHIRPIASFDFSDKNWKIEAFSLDNLQPLFSNENCSKGSLYIGNRYKINRTTTI